MERHALSAPRSVSLPDAIRHSQAESPAGGARPLIPYDLLFDEVDNLLIFLAGAEQLHQVEQSCPQRRRSEPPCSALTAEQLLAQQSGILTAFVDTLPPVFRRF